MSHSEREFPWRVSAIAVVLFAVVALVAWAVFFRDVSPTTLPASDAAGLDPTGAPTGGDPDAGEPTVPPTQPGAADPTPDAAATQAAQLDPLGSEARAELSRARANAGTMDLQLFLIVPGLERLIAVPRTVDAPLTIDAQIEAALDELINWSGTETVSPLPSQAGVREVWVSPGGIAYVDFDTNFWAFSGGGSLGELHTVYGVVTTLTMSFPEIRAVQILIDGELKETLAGHVDLSLPLVPSADWALIESGTEQQQGGGQDAGQGSAQGSGGGPGRVPGSALGR